MKWLLIGLLLLVSGCSSMLGPLRSAWNTTNADAVDLELRLAAEHQAALDVAVDSDASQEERLAEVDRVEAKFSPAFEAYRLLRAVLATTRAALKAAELAEENGEPLDATKIAALVSELLTAVDTVEGAIP